MIMECNLLDPVWVQLVWKMRDWPMLQVVSRAMSRKLFLVWCDSFIEPLVELKVLKIPVCLSSGQCQSSAANSWLRSACWSPCPSGSFSSRFSIGSGGGTMRSSVCEKDTEERDDDEPLVCVFMRVDFMIYHSQFTHAKPTHLLEKHEISVWYCECKKSCTRW